MLALRPLGPQRCCKKAYPFGPFLLLGALLGILFGDPLLGDLAARVTAAGRAAPGMKGWGHAALADGR